MKGFEGYRRLVHERDARPLRILCWPEKTVAYSSLSATGECHFDDRFIDSQYGHKYSRHEFPVVTVRNHQYRPIALSERLHA